MLRRSVLAVAALLALVLASSGCAAKSATRVAVDKDQTDIVFGFTQPTPRPAPTQAPQPQATDANQLPTFTPFPNDFIPSQPSGPCPTADPNAPVNGAVGQNVVGRPKPGAYEWRASGSFDVQGHKIPLSPQTDHYLRNVKTYDDPIGTNTADAFTFETIERQLGASGSGYWLFHWQLKTHAPNSDPEDGLVLKGIDALGSNGKVTSTYFDPFGAGLLMVPYPIKAGEKWNTASVDLNRRSFSLQGQVLTRQVIDICGTLVEGWHVHTTISEPGAEATLDMLVVPQNAGQIIATTLDGTFLGTTYSKASFHTTTLDKPKPLPKELS